ncbi:MAG: T9SS type A sorting domain-containing protein, partial [Bacteroidota bacterium]
DNLIDSINLNPFSALRELDLSDNQLTEIDLTSNKNLAELSLSSNSLSELTLDSLEDLRILNVVSNQLQGVDLSNNTSLTSLQVSSNSLTSLNMRNGNNAILGTFDATNNLELFCIEVDDPNAIGAAWVKDEQASYSDDCHYNEIFVPDDAFEQALIDLGYDENATGPLDDYIPIARGLVITSLNISGYGVQDLTGLEELINLKSLNARDNEIRAISLDSLAQLEVLNVANNLIERVDLTSLDSLTSVDVSGNRLDSLDISQNQELSILRFSANSITGIDITQNPNLRIITGQVNQLFAVDANNGFNQNISTFNLSDNPNLTCILVDDIDSANSYTGWVKDEQAQYKLVCDDDDNDGVPDDEDICPATPFGSQVDLFGCDIFSLPATNFTILTTGESCRAGNNGLINIFAERILPYTATLTSELDSVSTYDFGDRVEIRNVRAGTYRLCITVAEKDNYEQCYTLTITEPEDLKVFSSGRSSNGRMSFEMTGGDEYMVDLNGEQFETTEGNITLRLKLGKNTIRIRTKINCQGTFEQTIFYSEKILPFPNPFTDELKVSLGNVEAEEVLVNIYSTSGKLQLSKMYDTSAGVIDNIDTSDLQGGVYILELISSSEKSTFKIMKR